jgi:hypothetical protein
VKVPVSRSFLKVIYEALAERSGTHPLALRVAEVIDEHDAAHRELTDAEIMIIARNAPAQETADEEWLWVCRAVIAAAKEAKS